MQHLNRSILEDYEITPNAPEKICAVQFGDDAALMGAVDRLIDDANQNGANIGLAVVQPGSNGFAKALKEQDCLFTTYVRGDLNEKEVRKEQVVQSVLSALDPDQDNDALMALARSEDVRFLILSKDETGEFESRNTVCAMLCARFLVERKSADLPPIALIICGDSEDCADRVREQIAQTAQNWQAGDAFSAWLGECQFFPAMIDCLVSRSSAEEAARLCTQMNYADAMIHLAEPYALWAIQADETFRSEFHLEQCAQIRFVDDIAVEMQKKHRIFDAGLFAMAALGCLHGNETLADCMKDDPLRELVGHALYDEIMPFLPFKREEIVPYVIACCERYENPLNDNHILDAARGLLRRFNVGVLPTMRAYANEHFEAPKHLSLSLAATAMLYAGARANGSQYEVLLDEAPEMVHDDPEALHAFSLLSPDMPADSLAYAVLADRSLWNGCDLREIDGLEESMAANMAMVSSMLAEENA